MGEGLISGGMGVDNEEGVLISARALISGGGGWGGS